MLREDIGITSGTDDIFRDDTEQNDQVTTDSNDNEDGKNLRHYMLARDRVRREIRPSPKYAHDDVIAYALNNGDNWMNLCPLRRFVTAKIKLIGLKHNARRNGLT